MTAGEQHGAGCDYATDPPPSLHLLFLGSQFVRRYEAAGAGQRAGTGIYNGRIGKCMFIRSAGDRGESGEEEEAESDYAPPRRSVTRNCVCSYTEWKERDEHSLRALESESDGREREGKSPSFILFYFFLLRPLRRIYGRIKCSEKKKTEQRETV